MLNDQNDSRIHLVCKRLYPDAILPSVSLVPRSISVYSYLMSETGRPIKLALAPGIVRAVPTGVAVSPDDSFTILLHTHILLASRGIKVMNTLGSLNSTELVIWLHNSGTQTEWIEHGDPIAQIVVLQLPTPVVVVDDNDVP